MKKLKSPMTLKLGLVDAVAYPMALDSDPSMPLTPRLQHTSTSDGSLNSCA